jgi:hypothetical protein
MFSWLSLKMDMGNYKKNVYKSSVAQFGNSLFLFYLQYAYLFTSGYPVNLCPYLWLPCYSVFLSLATMLFCNIIPGYPVILYSYLWLPCHFVLLSLATRLSFSILMFGVILYFYPWLPCHPVFLSLATMSFCIFIPGYLVILFPCL